MEYTFIVPVLALGTLLAVCIFALVSKAKIERRRHDPNAPVSSLAKDSPSGGPFAPAPAEPRSYR